MDLNLFVLSASCAVCLIGAVFSILTYLSNRRLAKELSLVTLGRLLRDETEVLRRATEDQSRGVREELSNLLTKFQEAIIVGFGSLGRGINDQIKEFSIRLDSGILSIEGRADGIASKLDTDIEKMRSESVTNRDSLRGMIEQKLEQNLTGHAETARILKDELSNSFHRLGAGVNDSLTQSSQQQGERLGNVNDTLSSLTERLEKAQEGVRTTVEARLETIRSDNAAKLEQMRATVEEKLHDTLEQRLNNSFKQVSDQLEQVFRGLGEMQNLATGVGDLKRMMTNVRTRGTWGEVTLASILEQAMAPDQYEKNVEVRPGSNQRVEFSIRLPGGEGGPLWLPIDAKFPTEDYERLVDASEQGDVEALDLAGKALETRIRQAANEIATKYISPPFSTDFAILLLPTEGLYAEVIRRPGLSDYLQRENRILITGPTTLLALLNSLRMGFRTLAIQKRSSEVWQILGAVKTEFSKYGSIIDKVQKKLQEASNTIDGVSTRKRAIDRKLRSVEMLPEIDAAALLATPNSDEPELSSIEESQSIETDP